jgi:sugar/nucleoside kinase (ribokinase family)
MADVGCAGLICADTICGPIERLPHSGELLSVGPIPDKIGGCPTNVAIDLAKQNISVDICGCIGNDSAGDVVLKSVRAHGAGGEQIRRLDTHPTSRTVIVLVEGEDRRFLHNFGANAAFEVGHIRRDWIDTLKVFYLGGLCALPGIRTDELVELLKYCRHRGVTSVIDVVVPQTYSGMKELAPLMPHIDFFMPNDDEAMRLTGEETPEKQLEAFLQCGLRGAVITCGPHGSIAVCDGKRWKADSYRVSAIDPSGSGDAFDAGFIAGILYKWDMPKTLRYAAALGASAVTAIGTTDGVFTAAEAEKFIGDNPLDVRSI